MWDAETVVLGIESSCDETAAALVTGDRRVLAQRIASQEAEHAPFGGVVPEIAARAHVEKLAPLIEAVLADAGMALTDCDAVAATAGPGLIGGVMVGLVTAKALAMASERPLIAINHLEGHALSPRLVDPELEFPYALLLVSGGHCQLVGVGGAEDFRLYGSTIDDAVGEAFDKAAKILGLPYPGGPAVEEAAKTGNPRAYALPRPMKGRSGADFSFSGLKTALRLLAQDGVRVEDAAASFQAAVIESLVDRTRAGMALFRQDFPKGDGLVVAGGVAANQAIGTALDRLAREEGFVTRIPPPRLCTDNAAMIAWAGVERLSAGHKGDALGLSPKARWPLATSLV